MPFIRLKCTRGNLRFLPQYRARSRLRRKQALRAQSSFGEAGQSAHWIGKLKKSPPRITPKRDWAAMETNHAASPGSASFTAAPATGDVFPFSFRFAHRKCVNAFFACPIYGITAIRPAFRQTEGRALCRVFCGRARRGGAPPLASAPHAGMRQRRFCLPDKRHHRKTPSVRQTGAGGYVARLAAAPAAGMLSPCFLLQVPNCANVIFCLPGAALKGACGPRR